MFNGLLFSIEAINKKNVYIFLNFTSLIHIKRKNIIPNCICSWCVVDMYLIIYFGSYWVFFFKIFKYCNINSSGDMNVFRDEKSWKPILRSNVVNILGTITKFQEMLPLPGFIYCQIFNHLTTAPAFFPIGICWLVLTPKLSTYGFSTNVDLSFW